MRSWWFSQFISECQSCLAQQAEVVLESCPLPSAAPLTGVGEGYCYYQIFSAITKGQIPSFSKGHIYLISSFSCQDYLAVQWQCFVPPRLWHCVSKQT